MPWIKKYKINIDIFSYDRESIFNCFPGRFASSQIPIERKKYLICIPHDFRNMIWSDCCSKGCYSILNTMLIKANDIHISLYNNQGGDISLRFFNFIKTK